MPVAAACLISSCWVLVFRLGGRASGATSKTRTDDTTPSGPGDDCDDDDSDDDDDDDDGAGSSKVVSSLADLGI